MPKTNIEREKIYEVAKTIATSVYSKKCCEEGCAKCSNNGDCTPMEMAYHVIGAGYVLGEKKNKSYCEKHRDKIETLAKTIAFARGYGCTEEHSCSRCSCASAVIDCIPLTIARQLIAVGYEKKEV
jgi:hypothetical protein